MAWNITQFLFLLIIYNIACEVIVKYEHYNETQTIKITTTTTAPTTTPPSLCLPLQECHCLIQDGKKVIDCSNRDLTQLPFLGGLVNQEYDTLLLNNNKIKRIPSGAFRGLNIRKMNLSHNSIKSLSDRAFQDLTMLEELIMDNCNLGLTPIGLNPLTNMKHLELQRNDIRQINTKSFENMKKLEYLDLSHNDIAITAPFDAFVNLHRVKHLHMENCGLYSIPHDAIGHMTQLETLNLQDNKIWTIPSDFFPNIQQLEVLNLYNNPIELNSEDKPFEMLTKLRVLKLGGCIMEERKLHRNMLATLGELRTLAIASCDIHQIDSAVFSHLDYLTDLDLSGNHFILKAEIFNGVTDTVEKLHFNDAGLVKFPSHIYEPFRRLTHAYLNENEITMLPAHPFSTFAMKGVHILLNNNQIKKISNKVLQWSPRPVHLHLEHNRIKTLSFIADDPCRFQLATIYLDGNNISCDCEIFKAAQMKAFTLVGTCTKPTEYQGLHLSWRPNYIKHQDLFLEHNITTCDLPDRPYQRYECTCRKWMEWNSPELCGVVGASAVVTAYAALTYIISFISTIITRSLVDSM